MGQQTLQTIIAISGRVDNSFGQIGEALIGLGSQIDGISQKIIDFGKESVNIYRDYEDGILETRSTLSTLYSNSSDLDRAMDSLEDHAQKWAASTIFHTDDVADAMATAAHAGWNYDRIILGIPSSMLIAQAGSMELTQSVDYLAKMLASTNTDFQESERFIDQWARAADLVATDIPELGNAFIRLGSSAQFADSNAELFTMLAVLANVGTVGESAGTGVRNMMMRLIAPSQKAAEAMEGLGFSSDELEEAFEGVDAQSEAAYQRLAEYGFSAYDAQGNLKSFIDIFTDLNWALDQLPTEQEQNKILATIFPTRTLAYAKAMLNAVKDGSIYSIYEAIYGDSEGYAQEKSDILMSGLTGSMEILGSKWEELKRKTGETLAPDVESVADTLGGMIDKINDMDEGTFDALVSGVSVIAAAGPGLLLAGGAFRLIGYLLTPAGGIGLGLVALTAAAAAIKELEEADFANQFGDLKLDPSSFTEYVDSLGTSFETAYADVNEFNTALGNAVTQYTTASETFKTNLITNMLTGATLTADDIATLEGLGDQMHAAIMSGIENNYAADMQTITNAFGGDELAQEDSTWSHIIQVLEIGFNNAVSRANELSQELREAMTSAFDDGTLTGDEIAGIQSIMDEMNEVMAMQTSADNYAAQQTLLRKAQTMGLDSLQELSDSFDFENLMSGNFTDTGYQSGLQSIVDRLKEVYDFGAIEIPKGLESIADYYAAYQLMYGDINPEDYLIGAVKTPEVTEYSAEIAKQTIAAVGGGMDAYLAEIGNGQDARDVNAAWSEMSREARTEYQNMVDALQEVYDFDRVLAGEMNMFAEAGSAFRDDAAVYSLLYGNASHDLEKYKITAEIDPVLDEGAVQDAAGSQEIKVPVEPEVPEDTGELEMPSTVTGAAEAAQAAHSDAQSVMDDPLAQSVHVSDNGSAAATRGAIASTFSTPITQYINVVQRGGGGLMNRLAKYADGGRADEPSIFGEAGPEWAIPEEHSERTAWLLDAARQASGFTWPELLTRNGGLNAGGGNTPSQLIYSPTIIANDANGVEQRLIEDKARLEKWYQDKQLHDDVEVYA